MTYVLWTVQVVLAALFVMLGQMKLSTPPDVLAAAMGLPGELLRAVGLAELLGAAGLILPALLRIRPGLTPLAAAGLALIAAAAGLYHVARGETAALALPLVVTVLAAFVAYGRWRLAPIIGARSGRRLAPAR